MSKPWVYIAGPYSNNNVKNTRTAVKIANMLIISFVPIIPHLTMLWDMMTPKPYETWLEYDKEILKKCDVLYRFKGQSSGADGEEEAAMGMGMPVFRTLTDLYEWRKGWEG